MSSLLKLLLFVLAGTGLTKESYNFKCDPQIHNCVFSEMIDGNGIAVRESVIFRANLYCKNPCYSVVYKDVRLDSPEECFDIKELGPNYTKKVMKAKCKKVLINKNDKESEL